MRLKFKFFILTFIIISSIYLINTTTSRYLSEINSKSNVDVAIPQIELETNNPTNTMMFPGDSREVEFYVKNYKDTKINEVLMTYYIDLDIIDSSIPLQYRIYDITENTQTELVQTAEGFGPITLNYGEEEERHFKIIFTWDENDNNVSYASKQFSFNLEVNATQEI